MTSVRNKKARKRSAIKIVGKQKKKTVTKKRLNVKKPDPLAMTYLKPKKGDKLKRKVCSFGDKYAKMGLAEVPPGIKKRSSRKVAVDEPFPGLPSVQRRQFVRKFSAEEATELQRLVDKHGDNFHAMVLDSKLNRFQRTAAQLRKMIRQYRANQGEASMQCD